MNVTRAIESLLFVASKPLTIKKIADLVSATTDDVAKSIVILKETFNTEEHGIQIAQHGGSVQMITHPLSARLIASFLKEERSGELTRPALETLTIIAYRGPIPKAEIDLVRGVNCSLILRNLMVRGLVSAHEDKDKMATLYEISFDFLRHLGLRSTDELPDYVKLNSDERLERLLRPVEPQPEATEHHEVQQESEAISDQADHE